MPDAFSIRPAAHEFAPYYARYVDRVPEGDILQLLASQIDETAALFGALSDAQAGYRYAPDKWSARQIVGHVSDAERVFLYRALAFARGETNALPSFDQNSYVANARFDERPITDLVAELRAVRASTLAFARGLDTNELARGGIASENLVTVRGLLYIIAGHELAHVATYRERYLSPA